MNDMITEDYVSFEVAKLLKEKGFDEKCRAYWDSRIDDLPKEYEIIRFTEEPIYQPYDNMHSIRKRCLAPTHQMAMKWLREEKHYYIQIMLDSWALGGHSGYYIVIQDVNSDFSELSPTEQVFFETHEDAVEAALKYSLENLL